MVSKQEKRDVKSKDRIAQNKYGMSYEALCGDRKRIVDTLVAAGMKE